MSGVTRVSSRCRTDVLYRSAEAFVPPPTPSLPMPLPLRRVVMPLVCLAVASCDGSGDSGADPGAGVGASGAALDGPSPTVADQTVPAAPPDEVVPDTAPGLVTDTDPDVGEVGVPVAPDASSALPSGPAPDVPPGAILRVDATSLCPTVGETFELAVGVLPPGSGDAVEPIDVTASVTLSQSLGEGLELLSRGDGAIALRMNARDIVALRADFADEAPADQGAAATDLSTGRTVYVGGFAADAPSAALMRKPVPRGCLYALRLPEQGFCGTAISRGGRASLGSGDLVVAIDGCDHDAPAGLPVIELDADVRG